MRQQIPPPAQLSTAADGRWEQRSDADAASVGLLRAAIVAFADRHGVDATTRADIALAASEALTNAVVHAFIGRPPGTLLAIAESCHDGLVVRIIDDGRGMFPRTDSPGLGLGLALMAELASDLDVRAGPGGQGTETCLTFRTARPAPQRATAGPVPARLHPPSAFAWTR
jgi:serine/threonine-protein kinase RsbW